MPCFKTALASLLLLSNAVRAEETCADIGQLGVPSLDAYNYSIAITQDPDECEYVLEINFKHDENNPLPTDPAVQCNPAVQPPVLASNGLPYYAFHWSYESVPDAVKEITGIDHISIDWNACGHPPLDIFAAPHYDLHIYRESPEFRTCMTCANPPIGTPNCDPAEGAQTTASGNAFFDVLMATNEVIQIQTDPEGQPANMPAGFVIGLQDMIPLMGGHAWNLDQNPPSSLEWVDPIWIMGSYGGLMVDYEPMIPFAFFAGAEEDVEFTEELVYESQTITELPSSYTVSYNATTKMITVTLKGPSAPDVCTPVESEAPDSGATAMIASFSSAVSAMIAMAMLM